MILLKESNKIIRFWKRVWSYSGLLESTYPTWMDAWEIYRTQAARQDLLPAARDFLLVTARVHPQQFRGPFPSPANNQLLRSSRILWQNKPKHLVVGRAGIGALQFGGAENRLAAIALQNPSTESCHALRAIRQLCFCLPVR
jgi:hypothetical protein